MARGRPEIGPDERAKIALALGMARKRRPPDVVGITIMPAYGITIAFEQKEFGLAKHLVVKIAPPHVAPRQSAKRNAEAVVDIATAFGFKPDNTLSQWVDEDGDYHVLGTDHDFHS